MTSHASRVPSVPWTLDVEQLKVEAKTLGRQNAPVVNRRKILLGLLAAGIVVALLVLAAYNPAEPRYKGKTLSSWISIYVRDDGAAPTNQQLEEADDAVRHIGTNAIPFLLRWCAYDWQRRAQRRYAIYRKLPYTLQSVFRFLLNDPKKVRYYCAASALGALDPNTLKSNPDFVRFISERGALGDRFLDAIASVRDRDTLAH